MKAEGSLGSGRALGRSPFPVAAVCGSPSSILWHVTYDAAAAVIASASAASPVAGGMVKTFPERYRSKNGSKTAEVRARVAIADVSTVA